MPLLNIEIISSLEKGTSKSCFRTEETKINLKMIYISNINHNQGVARTETPIKSFHNGLFVFIQINFTYYEE